MTDRAVALTRSYGRRLDDLRAAARQTAGNQWRALGRYDEADIGAWVEAMAAFTVASRAAAARLTAGYLHAVARTNRPVAVSELPAVDPEKWRQPFMSTWATLARTADEAEAVAAGMRRASDTQATIISSTARQAAAVVDAGAPHITGWNRVPSGACCRWCADMAAVDWPTADEAALGDQHDNCSCGVVPIIGDTAPGRTINTDRLAGDPSSRYVTATGGATDSA